MAVLGQGDKSMEVYSILPSCHMGESEIPGKPVDRNPPRLPSNHPPTQSLPVTRGNYMIPYKIKLLLSAVGISIVIGIVVGGIVGFKKSGSSNQGKNIHSFQIHVYFKKQLQ